MNIGEFFVTLGVKADTFKVKDFAKAVSELPLDVAGAIAGLAGIDYELVKIANEAMNASVAFQLFSSQTGLSWHELERWQIVAQQANVSADAVASSVTALQRQMAEIRLGRGNIAPFQLLGIGVNQNAFQVLDQLRERIRGLDSATATNIISQMGLDPSMIQVLRLSNAEFKKLAETVGGLSGDNQQSFLAAKKSLVQFGLQAKYLGFEVVANLADGFVRLVNAIKELHIWMPGLAIAAAALGVAFAPWTTAIIALILALEDLSVYFRGGDSVTGMAIQGLKKLSEVLDPFVKRFATLGTAISGITALANPMGALASLGAKAAASVMNQNVTINVNSSAPAHDVAQAIEKHLKRAASQASLQTNQQGH